MFSPHNVTYQSFVRGTGQRRKKDFIRRTKQNGGVETGPVHINVNVDRLCSITVNISSNEANLESYISYLYALAT